MRGYFGLGQLSATEKSDILDQHKSLYNGYQTMQPQYSNTQPLTVYDFAGDKDGMVVNNKGEVKKYTNMGINEQLNTPTKQSVEIKRIVEILKSIGFKNSPTSGYQLHMDIPNDGAVKDKKGNYNPSFEAYIPLKQDGGFGYTDGKTPQLWIDKRSGLKPGKDEPNSYNMIFDLNPNNLLLQVVKNGKILEKNKISLDDFYNKLKSYTLTESNFVKNLMKEQVEENEMCNECGGMMYEGECSECGYRGEMEEETGHLDDIYDEQDLDPTGGFDYIEGPSNDVDTFEGMHKNLYKEDEYEDTDNEDDGFEDIQVGDSEMYEQGGNADDMDVDDVEPAYDFVSNGPMDGGDTYPVNELDEQCLDCDKEYETMESAWSESEIDEVDVSGSQGIYGDMDPAYDFDSEGPGSAGPYQHSEYNEGAAYIIGSDGKARDRKPNEKISAFSLDDFADDDDYEEGELEIDFDKFDPRDKSWEEIKAHTGDWDEIDEDLQESFISQKNKVMEMMNRMKIIK